MLPKYGNISIGFLPLEMPRELGCSQAVAKGLVINFLLCTQGRRIGMGPWRL